MMQHEKQDHINDARNIAVGLQSLICETRTEVVIEVDALYALLGCIIHKLDTASR